MLGVGRDRARCTKAVELNPLGLGHGCHSTLQGLRIELLAHLHQGMQGGVENLQAVVGNRVVFVDRELTKTGASSQALRQFQLQILKP
ncbi:hypothetical protein PS623_01660 [Pseudomonas fluorescens]|nr:hypothetical protein PS623_01660 [Pseudomonas fluorescens]